MPKNCEECNFKVVCKPYWERIREQYTRPTWCPCCEWMPEEDEMTHGERVTSGKIIPTPLPDKDKREKNPEVVEVSFDNYIEILTDLYYYKGKAHLSEYIIEQLGGKE